jgi:hypothetical protein
MPLFLPVVAGLFGVWIGAWLTTRRDRESRRFDFIKRQIEEFYAPLVGLRADIRAKSELRVKVSDAAGAAWADLCRGRSPEDERRLEEREWPTFEKIISYNNEQLQKDLIPSYQAMLTRFRERGWLAEASTRGHYATLVEYVEIWNRFLEKSLPSGVLERLGHSEESLYPLYEDAAANLARLRERLRTGSTDGEA